MCGVPIMFGSHHGQCTWKHLQRALFVVHPYRHDGPVHPIGMNNTMSDACS